MYQLQAILMLGGHDGQQWATVMHLFNPGLNTVREFDHVPFAQGYGGTVLLGRSIYVIGGGDGLNWNKTAYNFDLDSKDWFQVGLYFANTTKRAAHCGGVSQRAQRNMSVVDVRSRCF